ncbi:MAG: hypothetical protein Q8861_13395 [Bacteroidota bacterium]|nr:hypothetical protein [Bacteroidota bacterium]
MEEKINITVANERLVSLFEFLEELKRQLDDNQWRKTIFTSISHEDLENFLKISALFAISELDLIVAIKQIESPKYRWEEIFFVKSIYLTIYEVLITYNKYSKFLNEHVNQRDESVKEKYKSITEKLKYFKQEYKYSSEIGRIRNNVSGHISVNFNSYYETVLQFDRRKVIKMSRDFFTIMEDIHNFLIFILLLEKAKIEDGVKYVQSSLPRHLANFVVDIQTTDNITAKNNLTEKFDSMINEIKEKNNQ